MELFKALWYIHGLLTLSYIAVIIYYLWSRFIGKKEIWEQIYDVRDPHRNSSNMDDVGNMVALLIGGHAFAYGMAIKGIPLLLIGLIIAAGYCFKRLIDVEPIFYQIGRYERERKRGINQANPETVNQFEGDEEHGLGDDFFAYSGGSDQRSESASGSSPAMPYGVDRRHPDDARLWAVVDDPSASDAEQIEALRRIQKNQAKRKGVTGRDVARTA